MRRIIKIARSTGWLVGLLLGLLVGVGWSDEQGSIHQNPKVVGAPLLAEPGRPGGELKDASTSVPASLNPLVEDGDLVRRLLHAGLVEVNPLTLEIEPALAESFQISADRTRVTFTLREGVRWSDGAPFTVEDVLFTLNDVLLNEEIQEGLGFEPPFRPQVTRLDRHRVEFALEGPLADQLLIQAAELPILPRHRLAEAVRSPAAFAGAWGLGTPADQIVGLGPFRLKEVRKTGIPYISERVAAIVFERNSYYWKVDEAGTQLPYLDRFTRIFVQDDAEALRALKAGEIDLLAVRSSKEAAQLAREPQVELVVDGPIIGVSFLAFHQDVEDPHLRGLFRDVRFRRAVAYATDRAGILTGVPERAPFLISRESFVHPLSPFFSEEAMVRYPFDLAQAAQLLDGMGLRDRDGDGIRDFPDGTPVAFELLTNEENPIRVAAGRLYAQNLAEVGIKVDFRPLPFARLVERLNLEEKRPDYQAMIVSFGIEDSVLDPGYLFCLFHSRGGCHIYRFSDAQGEDLSEAQRRIDSILEDPGATPEVLVELQRLLTEDLPLIPLWSKRVVTAHRGEVQNVQKINVFGHLTFLEVLWRE